MNAAIVGAVLQSTIPYLLRLIEENRRLISSNYDKIDDLSKNLHLLNKFMIKYTEDHYKDDILMGLAEEIRMRVHEVEDVLETYIVEELLYKKKNVLSKAIGSIKHLNNLKTVGRTIQELSGRVEQTRRDNRGYASLLVEGVKKNNAISKNNQLEGYPEADRIIGFEDAADDVLKLLGVKSEVEEQSTSEAAQQSESKQLKVVSIHGMLGLGKTTLANKVLTDEDTEYEFFTRIFISVTKKYEKKEVLLSILRSLKISISDQNMSVAHLVNKVKEELKCKYLVVVDDVWKEEHWDDLKGAFPDNKNGSRVLVTTRDVRVARYVSPKCEPYQLRFMEQEEAEELLRTKVFEENKCPEKLTPIERLILEKCNGLPLAIVVTGGILKTNPKDANWWKDVLDEVPPLVDKKKVERIDRYIRLSYDNLHHEVKPCFLYLGVFPENFEIQVWKVLQLWIAEGFIPQHETASLERTAEQYFGELVDRNLLIVGKRTLSGKIKTCRIHDTLRDFCKKTAKAEDLFQAIHKNTNPSSSRRLCCINSQFSEYICGGQPAEKVRSFLSFGQDETKYNEDPGSSIFKPFKLLRVFDISSIYINFHGRFPTKLPNLVLLKFIAINFNLKTFPKSMSSLRNLEALIVHTTEPTLDIQADIWTMTKLRLLHTNSTTSLPKCQDQSSSSEYLQTMCTISPQSLTKEAFGRTKKLKKLGISGNLGTLVKSNGDSNLFECLCSLSSLENLKLHSDESKLHALPQPDKFPRNLKRLSLHKTGLDWNNHMPILGRLQSLEVLKLKDKAFMGVEWKTEKGGFRSLKVLFIGDTNLEKWEAKADDLPELRCLILKHIESLEQMPSDFEHMKNLEKIDLERTNSQLVKSAKDIQKSRPQIKLSVYPPEKVITK